jgi:HEAT repeat protein
MDADVSVKSTEELIQLLKDPNDPNNLFDAITVELGKRGASAEEATPALAVALTYPRRDSYMAGFALIKIGPDAKLAVPILASELNNERDTVRRYAALSLGAIGKPAICSVPELAKLLWHNNSETRAAAAIALDSITGINLVDPEDKLDPQTPGIMPIDKPEGVITGISREWWLNTGKKMVWPTENCELSE